jgi:hypothetical protein
MTIVAVVLPMFLNALGMLQAKRHEIRALGTQRCHANGRH